MARTTPRPAPTQEQRMQTLYVHCPSCNCSMWVAYENQRTVTTLDAVVRVRLAIRRCRHRSCERYHVAYRPEAEGRLALPKHEFGLDVMAWIGVLRYAEHRRVPEIHRRLGERGVAIAERTVEHLLSRYEELVGLRWSDRARLREVVTQQRRLVVAVDGLQPDKGHEVLWIVRDVLSGEVLGAQSLLSSTQTALEGLLSEALAGLEVPVVGVISDGEEALRQAVAAVLPGVPHQLCQYHYLREASRPVWEADRHAKKELKKRVRGVRPLERQVESRDDEEAQIVRGYCAAVRRALTDDGRAPLDASGLTRRERLSAIKGSLERVAQKGGRCVSP